MMSFSSSPDYVPDSWIEGRPFEDEEDDREGEQMSELINEGNTAGFHYGTSFRPCNGVLHWTLETHTDGRQIAECDTCGSQCVPQQLTDRKREAETTTVGG